MLAADQVQAFFLAAVLITASPGPDNLMVLGLGASRGRRAGVAFGLGCALGCLSHTAWAVLGVSALLAATPGAFQVLRWIGGTYLVWLGLQASHSARALSLPAGSDSLVEAGASLGRLFRRGLLANAINPKVALFFLSFLPQFVEPARGSVQVQLAGLGVLFTLQAALLFAALGWAAGAVGAWLHRWPRVAIALDWGARLVFIGLGLRLILGL